MRRLSDEQTSLIVTRARALADATRVRILDVLARGELPVGRIADALSSEPSTVSKHLQVLFGAALVERRRSASTIVYSIADRGLMTWCRYLAGARDVPAARVPDRTNRKQT
jgi:DNA-binding transcriptional ArsR family regulator